MGRTNFLVAAGLALGGWAAAAANPPVDFFHDIQPVLREACHSCHGPEKQKGGLRLDVRERALQGGEDGPVLQAGHATASALIQRLLTNNVAARMPFKAEPLPAEKIALLRRWIDEGAVWPPPAATNNVVEAARHWAFQPLRPVEPPAVKSTDWPRTPVDHFILARLEAQGITPNPAAERRVLVRRAYLDLTGLPPTPEAVDAFVADAAPDAFARLVDQLLASPHYGERWARHWLDTARFGESHGFEQDYDRPYAYWYRDFVIKAFNDGMPFDQFIRWQLAGDEFAPEDPWALAATGFLGAGVFPTQLTEAEFEPARYDELDNMAGTTGTAMLGLTVGCARCHDHKFDPISSHDYYRFIATFAKTIRSNVELDFTPEKHRREKARFDAEHAALVAARDWFEREKLPALFADWLQNAGTADLVLPDWTRMELDGFRSTGGATLTPQADGSVLATGKNPDHDTFVFEGHTSATNVTGIRIEALADSSLPHGGPGRAGNGNFQFTDLQVSAAPLTGEGAPVKVALTQPRATFEQNASLAVAKVVDGDPASGWAVDPQFGTNHAAAFRFAEPAQFPGGVKLTVTLAFNGNQKHTIGRPRLSLATGPLPTELRGPGAAPELSAALAARAAAPGGANLGAAQRELLREWYRPRDAAWQRLDAAVREHLRGQPKAAVEKVMVASEGFKPIPHHADDRGFPHFYAQTFFLKRGDTRQKAEEVMPGYLTVLNHAPDGDGRWQAAAPAGSRTSWRRRALANWITDSKFGAGDLLARVAVNRVWQHHFGRGLVATANDFGTQGARPSHPELLDWLAADFQAHGWDVRRLHRLIMNSATYRESADRDAARGQTDPENQGYWHYSRQRLEAEAIRDSTLAVSGQLEDRLYGPGTLDEGMRRRSIYFFVKRSQFIPLLQLFDAPDPSVSVGGRTPTTVAPQALLFLNNPRVREYARALAARLAPAAAESPAAAITLGYRLALGRAPTAAELAAATGFLQQQAARYAEAPAGERAELARADFCQALFGLNEFIYLE